MVDGVGTMNEPQNAMKRPNITQEEWQRNGSTIFALTPYRGDSPRTAKLCPEGINRFSCHVQQDNSEASGGASKAEVEANASAIAALPDLLAALETSLSIIEDIPHPGNYAADSIRAALIKAGYEFP